ncbi:MAG: ABC transporter permease [Thermodesulfobacteriota bacterium]
MKASGQDDLAMKCIAGFLTRIGDDVIRWLQTWMNTFRFGARAVAAAFSPGLYNSPTRTVVQKQIYFTAWQILVEFTLLSALISLVVVQIAVITARQFGLENYALEVVIRALVLEVLPLITALFVALRSGAAINTEIVLMNINNEIRALEDAGVDPMRFEFMPRVVGGVISVLTLSAMSGLVALVVGYLSVYGFSISGISGFSQVVGKVFSLGILFGLWFKSFIFGLAVTIIPISSGLSAPKKLFFAPISVLHGMVRLFFTLMIIEVGSLGIKYIPWPN